MSRTTIEIDDELVERVLRRHRPPSKSAAVDLALRRLAGEPMSPERRSPPREAAGPATSISCAGQATPDRRRRHSGRRRVAPPRPGLRRDRRHAPLRVVG
jgi:hypothetical protein